MTKKPLEQKDIINLLDKLREETPEYPVQLAKSRKESFLKQIVDIKLSGEGGGGGGQSGGDEGKKGGRGGSGGVRGPGKSGKPARSRGKGSSSGSGWAGGRSGSGGSGAGLRRGTAGLGLDISLKSMFIFGSVVLLLTAVYLFRKQIAEVLAENNIIRMEETAAPSFASSSADQATDTPTVRFAPVVGTPSPGSAETGGSTGSGNCSVEDNKSGIPVTGSNTKSANPTPTQVLSQKTGTPTLQPQDNSIAGRLRFLLCILRRGEAASCK